MALNSGRTKSPGMPKSSRAPWSLSAYSSAVATRTALRPGIVSLRAIGSRSLEKPAATSASRLRRPRSPACGGRTHPHATRTLPPGGAELARERARLGEGALHVGGTDGNRGVEVRDPARAGRDQQGGEDVLFARRFADEQKIVLAEG